MATLKFSGLDAYIAELEKLTIKSREYCGKAIYEGAGEVADAIKREIQALPVGSGWGKKDEKISTITSTQKAGLMDGFGIAKLRQEGSSQNVRAGFAGYNGQKTTKYPNGQPNSVIARSVCSGTSFRQKNDFVGRAARASRKRAEEAMRKEIEEGIKRITGGM